jgi:hypothetical protein
MGLIFFFKEGTWVWWNGCTWTTPAYRRDRRWYTGRFLRPNQACLSSAAAFCLLGRRPGRRDRGRASSSRTRTNWEQEEEEGSTQALLLHSYRSVPRNRQINVALHTPRVQCNCNLEEIERSLLVIKKIWRFQYPNVHVFNLSAFHACIHLLPTEHSMRHVRMNPPGRHR